MKFVLNKDTLIIEDAEIINSGSVNYYEADVEYDESWNNLTIEAKIVKKGHEAGTPRGVINNKIFIDVEDDCRYCIGFVGYIIKDGIMVYQISSNLQPLTPEMGAGQIKTSAPALPTPTEWEIYINQIKSMVDNIHQVPSGGTTGQVLTKLSNNDEDADWQEEKDPTVPAHVKAIKQEDISNWNNKAEKGNIPTKVSELENDSEFINKSITNLVNYYLKTETYNKTEVNELIGAITTIHFEYVQTLPKIGQSNIIYLVPKNTAIIVDNCDEYIWFNNDWEWIGNTQIDLTNYATKDWVNTQISNFLTQSQIEELVNTELSKKENIFRYSTIPENPNYGDVIQYLGEDTEKYKYGHFYKYTEGVPAQVKVEKHSETITDISVDVNIFKESYPEAKKYTFVYKFDDMLGDYIWMLSDTMATVSFLTSGITITGTPTENDSFDVYYSYGTEEDWYEVEVETGTQFAIMPTPTKALQDKIIQYVGETYKTTTIDEFENEIETVIKTGSFWKCVFDKANYTYEIDTTVNSETTGIYYIKRLANRYMAKKLPEQYQSKVRYYKRVSEELIFKWEEVEMGKTTQYSSVGSADDLPLGTIIQYVGEGGNFYHKGTFLENVLIPGKYSVAEVTSETIGTYYTYDDMRDRYIEVILPDNYVEGETYYEKSSDAYRDWKTLQVSRPKFKNFNIDYSKYEFEDITEMGSEPEYNFKIYDEDITYFSNVEIINLSSPMTTWLSNHLIDKKIGSNEGYFNIKVNTNDFSDISVLDMYFNYLINEIDTGGILL